MFHLYLCVHPNVTLPPGSWTLRKNTLGGCLCSRTYEHVSCIFKAVTVGCVAVMGDLGAISFYFALRRRWRTCQSSRRFSRIMNISHTGSSNGIMYEEMRNANTNTRSQNWEPLFSRSFTLCLNFPFLKEFTETNKPLQNSCSCPRPWNETELGARRGI